MPLKLIAAHDVGGLPFDAVLIEDHESAELVDVVGKHSRTSKVLRRAWTEGDPCGKSTIERVFGTVVPSVDRSTVFVILSHAVLALRGAGEGERNTTTDVAAMRLSTLRTRSPFR